MDPYDTKISDILASRAFLEKHPGSSQLGSDIYSSAVNSVSEIMLRQRYTGQYVSQANNLVFGGQSSFFLTPGSVLNGIILSCTVSLPQYTRAPDLWLLNAIDSVEMVISGSSSIQSLKVNGRTHMDYILASLDSKKVDALVNANPFLDLVGGANAAVTASIPMNLFFSSDDISSVFPLDTSTLQSQIILNVRWKQNYNIFSGDATNAVTLPSAFTSLYLRVGSMVTISNDFALANELRKDREMVYSLPINYLQTYSQVVNMTSLSVENSVSLTSMPSGQLQCIIVSCDEVAREGASTTQTVINPYSLFGSIRMLYNGIEVYRGDNERELCLLNSQMADKDGVGWKWRAPISSAANANVTASCMRYQGCPVIVMPFANDISEVLRSRRHEHTKDYSGSTLQFFFTIAPGIQVVSDANIISSQAGVGTGTVANGTGNYRLNFTFVNAGLVEVSQQTVSLTM